MNSRLKSQCGAVLVVALVMLLLLTLIGVAAIRDSTVQERMAGNMRDRSLAFQSAEAGLKTAEDVLGGVGAKPNFNGSQKGYGGKIIDAGNAGFWVDPTKFDWNNLALRPTLGIGHVSAQPQYYVELLTSTPPPSGADGSGVDGASGPPPTLIDVYRVTSRAQGGSSDTVVILQSTFRVGSGGS